MLIFTFIIMGNDWNVNAPSGPNFTGRRACPSVDWADPLTRPDPDPIPTASAAPAAKGRRGNAAGLASHDNCDSGPLYPGGSLGTGFHDKVVPNLAGKAT